MGWSLFTDGGGGADLGDAVPSDFVIDPPPEFYKPFYDSLPWGIPMNILEVEGP